MAKLPLACLVILNQSPVSGIDSAHKGVLIDQIDKNVFASLTVMVETLASVCLMNLETDLDSIASLRPIFSLD